MGWREQQAAVLEVYGKGYAPVAKEEGPTRHALQTADFIKLGPQAKKDGGTNCLNCEYREKDRPICGYNGDVDLRGLHVYRDSCCAFWDEQGATRPWQEATDSKTWDESKHPRGGDPKNPGRWSRAAGGDAAGGSGHADQPTRREPPPEPSDATRQTAGDTEVAERRAASEHKPSSSADKSPMHKSLEHSPVKRAGKLPASTNEAIILTLQDGTQAVFKPQKGETKDPRAGRYGVPLGSQYRREIAASRLAEILGFDDLVPTTTVRDQGGDIGSAQVYIDGAKEAADSEQMFDGPEDAARAAAFDYLIGHLDRHAYNWLVKGDQLHLIDNGMAFPTHYDGRDFFNMRLMHHAAKEELPLPDLTGLKDKWPDVERELTAAGLEPEAVKLVGERFAALVSGQHKRLADLPSLLDNRDTLADLVKQDRHARRLQMGLTNAS